MNLYLHNTDQVLPFNHEVVDGKNTIEMSRENMEMPYFAVIKHNGKLNLINV